MARKIQVMLTCDLDQEDVPAAETVTFSYNGATYAFELCEQHLEEFTKTMDGFAASARREEGRRGARRAAVTRPARPARGGAGGSTADIRVWARSKGFEVSDR